MANVANSEKNRYTVEISENGKAFGKSYEVIAVNDEKAIKEARNFTETLSKIMESTLKVSIKVKGEDDALFMSTCKFIEPVKDAKEVLKKAVKAEKA